MKSLKFKRGKWYVTEPGHDYKEFTSVEAAKEYMRDPEDEEETYIASDIQDYAYEKDESFPG